MTRLLKQALRKAVLLSVALVSVGIQCSLNPWQVSSRTDSANPSLNDSNSTGTQSRPDDARKEKYLRSRHEAIKNRIKDESLKFKIKNLSEVSFSSETESETRVWVGFGLTYPECVILKNPGAKRQALYVAPKTIGNKAAFDAKGEVIIAKTALAAPQSGWSELDRFLREQGIDYPIRLSQDDELPHPDGKLIVIESKSGTLYSMVFFSLHTESEDGQKALKVCRRIEREFNIRMGCGNPAR